MSIIHHISKIISNYKQKSHFACSILLIASLIQFYSMFVSISYKNKEDFLFNFFLSVIKMSTFGLMLVQNSNISLNVIFVFTIVFIFGIFISNSSNKIISKTKVIEYSSLFFPIAFAIISFHISVTANIFLKASLIILFIFYFLANITRVTILAENYKHINVVINNRGILCKIIMFSLGNILQNMKISSQIHFNICVTGFVILIWINFVHFTYLDVDLQYTLFVGDFFGLLIFFASYYQASFNSYFKSILVILFLILQRTGTFKLMFSKKYLRILNNYKILNNDEDIIIMLNLINLKIDKKLEDKKNFSFYQKLDIIYTSVFMLEIDQIGLVGKFRHNNTQRSMMLEQFFMKKYSVNKSSKLYEYLSYQYLSRNKIIRCVQYLFKIQLNSLNQQIKIDLLWQEIQKKFNKYYQLNFNVEQQKYLTTCLYLPKVIKIDIRKVIHNQEFLFELINKLVEISAEYTKLLNLLCDTYLEEKQISTKFKTISRKKQKFQKFVSINQNKFELRESILVYYIYLIFYCEKNYTGFNFIKTMAQQFLLNNRDSMIQVARQKILGCLASTDIQNIGYIIHANIEMKQFFKLDVDKIKNRRQNIQKIIPLSLISCHKQLMKNYLIQGHTKFIGVLNDLFVYKQGYIYPIQMIIKLYPYLNVLTFSCEIKFREPNSMYILYTEIGVIDSYSKSVEQIFKIKKGEYKSINKVFPEIFGTMSRSIKKHKLFNFTQKFSCFTNFKSNTIKLIFNNIKGHSFFLGICKIQIGSNCLNQQIQQQKYSQISIPSLEQYAYFDYKYYYLEQRLCKNYRLDRSIIIFKIEIIILLIVFISMSILQFQMTYSIFNKCITIVNFQSSFFAGFKLRSFQMSKRFQIYRAIDLGLFPDNRAAIYNISSLSNQLIKNQFAYIAKLDTYDQILMTYIATLPQIFIQGLINPIVLFNTQTSKVPSSFISVVSLLKTYYYQVIYWSKTQFQQNWNIISTNIDFFTNDLATSLQDNVFNNILTQNSKFNDLNKNALEIHNIIFISLVCILLVLLIVQLQIINKKKLSYIEYCKMHDKKDFEQKQAKNRYFQSFLKKLKIHMIYKFQIDIINKNIEYELNQPTNQTKKITQIMLVSDVNSKKKKILVNDINSRFQKQKIVPIILSSVILISLCWYMSVINESNANVLEFFQHYTLESSDLRSSAGSVLNSLVALATNEPNRTFFNYSQLVYLKITASSIYHRKYQQLLQYYNIDWNVLKLYFYTSLCTNPKDLVCPIILSGSLQKGLIPTLLSFTTSVINTYNKILTQGNITNSIGNINELIVIYELYLRNLLSATTSYGTAICQTQFSINKSRLDYLFNCLLIPILIIIVIVMIILIEYLKQQIYLIKKQFLSLLDIKIMSQKLYFPNQIDN